MPSSPAHERWEIAKFYCSGEVTQSKERMGTPGELDMLQVTLAVPWQHLWGTVVTGVRSCAALCLHTHLSSWGNYSQKRKGSRCLWESQHYPTCLNTSLKHSPEPSEITRRKRGFLLHKLLFHLFFLTFWIGARWSEDITERSSQCLPLRHWCVCWTIPKPPPCHCGQILTAGPKLLFVSLLQ